MKYSYKSTIYIIIIIISIIFSFNIAIAETVPRRVVKVGWFESEGLHPKDVDGNRYGYDYEYLQAIAQYANWEIEFVDGTWSECYEALKIGDIDLLGMMNKTTEREQIFDFAFSSTGTEIANIFIHPNNKIYSYQDFKNFNGMTIGVEKGAHQQELLKNYAMRNEFSYKARYYDTVNDAVNALNANKIDAVLSSNTDVVSGYKTIAQFNAVPFYYAVTKGNSDLLNELNSAISDIMAFNPSYGNKIYNKYFAKSLEDEVVFTNEELAYIQSNPQIYVYYDPNWQPLEYINKKDNNFIGIVPEIIYYINQQSGLNIQSFNGKTSTQVLEDFRENSGNIITSITYDYSWAKENNVYITQPFSSCAIVQVAYNNTTNIKTAAVVKIDFITKQIKKYYPNLDLIYYTNADECIKAVKNKEVDTTFINSLQSEYYRSDINNQYLNFHTIDAFRQDISLGVSTSADPLIFSILSKSLKNIPEETIQSIIYHNAQKEVPVNIKSLATMYPSQFLIAIALLLIVAFSIIGYIVHSNSKNSRRLSLERARFSQLIDLFSESLYEYSYTEDILTVKNSHKENHAKEHVIQNYHTTCLARIAEGENTQNMLYSCLTENEDTVKRLQIYSSDNVPNWYEITTKIIKNKDGKKIYALGKIDDIESEVRERERLLDKASKDSLTGLLNTGEFKLQAQSAVTSGGTLLLIDADKFKQINDLHGHYNGDKVLKQIALVLSNNCRKSDICGRIGGDEFAIYLPGFKDRDKLELLCKKILNDVSKIDLKLENINYSVSIGAAIYHQNMTYKDMFLEADKMLYDVKKTSRNNYKISD